MTTTELDLAAQRARAALAERVEENAARLLRLDQVRWDGATAEGFRRCVHERASELRRIAAALREG